MSVYNLTYYYYFFTSIHAYNNKQIKYQVVYNFPRKIIDF